MFEITVLLTSLSVYNHSQKNNTFDFAVRKHLFREKYEVFLDVGMSYTEDID